MATLYVSPTGSGLRDGSSIENAGTLSNLSKFIGQAGPGGQVLLLADQGAYQQSTQLSIYNGGTAGAPVTIRGIDSQGNPMAAEIAGNRPANWTPGSSEGSELFRLLTGANHLVFEDLSIKNVGNGAFRVGADISNLTIRDVNATNITRFLENNVSGTNTAATIDRLTVQNVTVTGYSKGAIRLQYDTHNVVIQNVIGDSQHQNGGLYISGIALDGTAHDVLISHTEMKNSYGNGGASEYWNGDGFSTEKYVYNVRFEDTVASGNTDAGYDLKSDNTILVRAVSEGNNRNYRLWGQGISLQDSVSIDPTHSGGTANTAHVWFGQNSAVSIDGLTFSDSLLPHTLFDLTQGGVMLHLTDTVIPALYQLLVLVSNGSIIETNGSPVGIALTGGTVEENAAAGTWVASLAAVDPDAGDTHTFAITGGASTLFEIVGSDICVKAGAVLDFETQPSYGLTIQVTDQAGLSYSQTVTINLTDVVETGTAGSDVLAGGAGGDRLAGGAGDDSYTVNAAGDLLVEAASQGTDLASVCIDSYTLTANVENLTYVGAGDFTGTGNTLNNIITGGAGNDTLHGSGGNDTVTGGAGSDFVYGDAGVDFLRGGNGADKISGGTQNDTVYGDAGDDWLMGDDGRDYLHGWLGNDLLDGGGGDDWMIGGVGNDTYVVNSAGDYVQEQAGEGYDTVQSSISYSLGANIDNLTLTGAGLINGTGNGGANTIVGNNAANVLTGGTGNDVIDGGAGNDTLVGGQGADTYLFGAGSGTDLVSNNDTDLGADKLVFGAGITDDQVWFARSGNDLVVSLLGSADRATLQGWYSSPSNQLDRFQLNDGTSLVATQVDQLVAAMSAFSMPSASIADLTATQQHVVETAIAANWHSAG